MRNTMLHAVDDLACAIESGRAPLCTGEDGLAALRIAMAARTSLRGGGKRIGVTA
jgi:predicted dehydrogenase